MEGEPRKSHPIFPGMTTVLLSRDRRLVRAAFEFRAPTRIGLSASPTEVSEGNGATTPHRHSAPRPPPPSFRRKPETTRPCRHPPPKPGRQPNQSPKSPKSNESQFKTTPPPNPRGRGPRLSPPPVIPAKAGNHAPRRHPPPKPGRQPNQSQKSPKSNESQFRPRRPPTPRDMGPGFAGETE